MSKLFGCSIVDPAKEFEFTFGGAIPFNILNRKQLIMF